MSIQIHARKPYLQKRPESWNESEAVAPGDLTAQADWTRCGFIDVQRLLDYQYNVCVRVECSRPTVQKQRRTVRNGFNLQ